MALDGTLALLRRHSRLWRVFAWTTWVVGAADFQSLFSSDKHAIDDRWKGAWARAVRRVVGLDVRIVHGEPGWASPRGRIVVSNHRTPLDIVVLLSLFGGHFLANHRVASAPIVGRGARRIGTVFVDREDRRSGAGAIRALRRLLAEGRSIIVFPEGTTFGGDEVRPFRGGAFTAGRGLPVDVLPVGLAYTPGHELASGRTGAHVRAFLARRSTPVWVSIGEPVPMPAGRQGIEDSFRERVQELVLCSRRAAEMDVARDAAPLAALPAPSERPAGEGR